MIRLPNLRQPSGARPRIDRTNPIARGLAYWTLPGFASPGQITVGTSFRTTPADGVVRGFGSTFGTGSTDSLEVPFNTHSTQRTFIVSCYLNGGGGGGLGRIVEKRVSGAQTEILFFNSSTNEINFGAVRSVSAGQWVTSFSTGRRAVIAVTYDASSTANDPVIYIDGSPVTITETLTPNGTITTNTDNYVLGNRKNDNARNLDGWIGSFFVWDRILTPAEIARISANPWQIFRPIVVPVKAPASGGTDYPVTQTEAATGTDTTSCLIGYAPAATEAGSASDAASAAMAAVVAIIEAASATSSEAAVTARQAAITEAATATDTTNGTASGDYTATITEAATASSLEAAVSNYLAAISESASASDSASASLPGEYSVSISEAASAIETAVCAMSALVTINEAAAAADVANWVGAITFTRAPRGSGYPGTKPTTTRPTMANTRR